jgi:NADPH-dependent 2,4-dienoyl-CoA reductase/sulfur reductase-like enzyme
VQESGLTAESGWIQVDRHTLETRFPGVYAVGDVVSIPLRLGKPLPKAGVFAHGEAEVVARNIAARIAGRPESERFNGYGGCFVEVGGGKAAFGDGDFYAEPRPTVKLHAPGRRWHLGKAVREVVAELQALSVADQATWGTRFNDLLDEVRRQFAERYLARPRLAVSEVAYLVGFNDPSAFHKAFRLLDREVA